MANVQQRLDVEEALKRSRELIKACANEAHQALTADLEGLANIIRNFMEKIIVHIDYGNAHHIIAACNSLNNFILDADIQDTERQIIQLEKDTAEPA